MSFPGRGDLDRRPGPDAGGAVFAAGAAPGSASATGAARLRRLGALGIAALWLVLPGGWAQPQQPSEHAVKAAFLLKFVGFVTWPESAFQNRSDPLVVTVLGKDPFGSILEETFENARVQGRRVVIQRVRDEKQLANCHLLYVTAADGERTKEIAERLQGKPTLIVGETEGFCAQGGIINFVRQGRNLRFEINPKAAERVQIKISSQLLKLAILVGEENTAPGGN